MKTITILVFLFCWTLLALCVSGRGTHRHATKRSHSKQSQQHHIHQLRLKQSEKIKHHHALKREAAHALVKVMTQQKMLDLWGQLWNQAPVSDKLEIVSHLFSDHPPPYLNAKELAKCHYVLPKNHPSAPITSFVELYQTVSHSSRVLFLEETIYPHLHMKSRQSLYRFLMPTESMVNHARESTSPLPPPPVVEIADDVPVIEDDQVTESGQIFGELPPEKSDGPQYTEEEPSLPPHSEDDGEDIDFTENTSEDERGHSHPSYQMSGAPPVQEEREQEQIQGELEMEHHQADHYEEELLKREGDSEVESDGSPSITPVGRLDSQQDKDLATAPAIPVMFNNRETYFDTCGACSSPAICHDGAGVGANQAICVQFCSADSDCQYKYQPKYHRSFPGLCLTHLGFCHGFTFAADEAGARLNARAIHSSWQQLISNQNGATPGVGPSPNTNNAVAPGAPTTAPAALYYTDEYPAHSSHS
jgi:hypothetical protein